MQYNFDSYNKQNSSQKRTVHIKQNSSEQLITSYNTSEQFTLSLIITVHNIIEQNSSHYHRIEQL